MADTMFKKRHDLRVYIEDHEFEQLKRLAEEYHMSVSGYARILIKKHLKEMAGDDSGIMPPKRQDAAETAD